MNKKVWQTAPNDIYHNQERYGKLVATIDTYTQHSDNKLRKYFIQNPSNLEHIKKLLRRKDSEGTSYVHRLKLWYHSLLFCHHTSKDFTQLAREDVDEALGQIRTILNASNTKRFIEDLRHIAKIVIPELDVKGRPDETIVPYAFRHLRAKIDPSRKKSKSIPSPDEILNTIQHFRQDPRLQALLSLEYESLARPQELLYLKNEDVQLKDSHAVIHVREHGKEGVKMLQCIDSFPYVAKWHNEHPQRNKPDAYFFCNIGDRGKHGQLTPFTVNKHLRNAVKALNIQKKITMYGLKRAGVTHSRLRGDDDVSIQLRAGWTTTKQSHTYDYSKQEQTFKLELIKRGIIPRDQVEDEYKHLLPDSKKCVFCNHQNGLAESICENCKRPLDRESILKAENDKDAKLAQMEVTMERMARMMEKLSGESLVVSRDEKDHRLIVTNAKKQ